MNHWTLCACLGALMARHANTASASLIAMDDFNAYTANATLNGQGAASNGWAGAYTVESGLTSNVTVVNGGLSYTNGTVSINGGAKAVQIADAANTVTNSLVYRQFNSSDQPAAGTTLWFGFLFKAPVGNENTDQSFIGVGSVNTISNSATFGDPFTGSTVLGPRLSGGTTNQTSGTSTTSISATTTYFLVGRLSTAGSLGTNASIYDRLELWINPDTTSEATLLTTTPTMAERNANFTSLAYFNVNTVGLDANDRIVFDEFRLGTSYIDVVPEPASIGAAGLVAMMLCARRRRTLR